MCVRAMHGSPFVYAYTHTRTHISHLCVVQTSPFLLLRGSVFPPLPMHRATDSYGVPLFCPPGTHNDIATVFFDEHTTSIKHIFGMEMENATQALGHTAPGPAPHVEPPLSNRGLLVVCAAYMALMVLCVGVSVPAGMFMPSIMVCLHLRSGSLPRVAATEAWLVLVDTSFMYNNNNTHILHIRTK